MYTLIFCPRHAARPNYTVADATRRGLALGAAAAACARSKRGVRSGSGSAGRSWAAPTARRATAPPAQTRERGSARTSRRRPAGPSGAARRAAAGAKSTLSSPAPHATIRPLRLGERRQVGVPRDEDVDRRGIERGVHRRPSPAGQDLPYRFGRPQRASNAALRPGSPSSGSCGRRAGPPGRRSRRSPVSSAAKNTISTKSLVHLRQLPVAPEQPRRIAAASSAR